MNAIDQTEEQATRVYDGVRYRFIGDPVHQIPRDAEIGEPTPVAVSVMASARGWGIYCLNWTFDATPTEDGDLVIAYDFARHPEKIEAVR